MRISAQLLQQIIDHARQEAPRECCGFLAAKGEEIKAVHPATNCSPVDLEFQMASREIYELELRIRQDGHEIGAVYHSHPSGVPVLSETDLHHARFWMCDWVVVGLAEEEPDVRCYQVRGTFVQELPVTII